MKITEQAGFAHRRSRRTCDGSDRNSAAWVVPSSADRAFRLRPPAWVPRASAELIGVDRAAAPASMAELGAYYETMRPKLYACEGRNKRCG